MKQMITERYLREEDFGKLCRNCINKKYHINLERKDCIYEIYSHACGDCGEMKHIVKGITFSARRKLLCGKRISKT